MEIDTASGTAPAAAGLSQRIMTLEPQFRERVWGGRRIRLSDPATGEAWIAMGDSRVADGRFAGRTVAELAAEFGADLMGRTAWARYGTRFPLLAKILDCADWLSVQVHPNNEQAQRMVGPGEFGKTEAWYFLETGPEAHILLGARPGTTPKELERAIREGRITEIARVVPVKNGDAVVIPAGTLHAVGPGLLLYEIQQASDTTYRAYDWGRPITTGRKLHIEESVAVMTTTGPRPLNVPRVEGPAGTARAVECEYFDLDLIKVSRDALALDTADLSFHILTAVDGIAEISAGDEAVRLSRFQSALVAGATGTYTIRAADGGQDRATVLRAAVPG